MLSLLQADLLKTGKRAIGWAMLAIGAAIIALILVTTLFAPPSADAPSFAYPYGLLVGAQVLGQLGTLMMLVFGAVLAGSEYGFDTWKNLLTRRPSRAAFIWSKWLVLLLALLVATVALPLWAQALGLLFSALLPPAGASALPASAAALQIALSALMPLAAGTIAIMGAVVGRSSVSGIIAGIVWMIGDLVLAQFLPGALKLVSFSVAQSSLAASLAGEPAPFGLLASALVLAAYLIVPLAIALWLFRRRDIV